MRVGVICEGYTDFLTIKYFAESDFKKLGFDISFHIIQPSRDETLPGGWSEVLHWLENNSPAHRNAIYLSETGLFLNSNPENKYDVLIFQIDSDIIEDSGFQKFLSKRGIFGTTTTCPKSRGDYIENVLNIISKNNNNIKEICLATVESCETWVIAAEGSNSNPELMNISQLSIEFDKIMRKYTSLRKNYKSNVIDKNKELRQELYEKMVSNGLSPIGCTNQYDSLMYKIEKSSGNKILSSKF